MTNTKELLERINSVSSMQQITKTMKLISVSKFSRAQNVLRLVKSYDDAISTMLNNNASDDIIDALSMYVLPRKTISKTLIIPISAHRGFCGAFNKNIIKKTDAIIKDESDLSHNVTVMPIGKKVLSYVSKRGYSVVQPNNDLLSNIDTQLIHDHAINVINDYVHGLYDEVLIIYNDFVNASSQKISVVKLLPFDIIPSRGNKQDDCIFEPTKSEVLQKIMLLRLKSLFTRCVVSSITAEHGSRMVSMNKADDNAENLIKQLRIVYNQTRQAAITNEIIEISAGASAING